MNKKYYSYPCKHFGFCRTNEMSFKQFCIKNCSHCIDSMDIDIPYKNMIRKKNRKKMEKYNKEV